jgi:ubiquinone/menaquinone biosynthesis C-methylase UbiE
MSHHAASAAPRGTAPGGARHDYLPGMGHDWLLPLYDPLTRALGLREAHRRLAEQAGPLPGQRVLEIGCGTGNLLLELGRAYRGTEAVGLDPDPKALARARRKAARRGIAVQLDQGFAQALPYPDQSFDLVLSAFMFHHLEASERPAALREVARALKPGGSLHLLDFGGAEPHSDGLLARLTHRNPRLLDNFGDAIPRLMVGAGLTDAVETGHRVTRLGRYALYRAQRPRS